MTGGENGGREVWLRGNVRPVIGLAAAAVALVATLLAIAAVAGSPGWLVRGSAAAGGVLLAGFAVIGWAATRPRLARVADKLEIRLTPTSVERVPLEAVECVFRGTEPLPRGADEAAPGFRVGTLVVRFAERAVEFRSRPTFRPWGSWDDGHAVIDGRWCEPLSRPLVERIAAALVEAKRQAVAGGRP